MKDISINSILDSMNGDTAYLTDMWERCIDEKRKRYARNKFSLILDKMEKLGYLKKQGYKTEITYTKLQFQDTEDQIKITKEIKDDMESSFPMDRLVCGDVGFGKTEIAIRAAFKAIDNNKQVAVLVPTTVLAFQHFKTFSKRLKDFPVSIDYLNRFRSSKQKSTIISELNNI